MRIRIEITPSSQHWDKWNIATDALKYGEVRTANLEDRCRAIVLAGIDSAIAERGFKEAEHAAQVCDTFPRGGAA